MSCKCFLVLRYRHVVYNDPLFQQVTLVGDAHSTLFATCLAASRTFEARFASIEVVPGSEYIRYVPDSSQLSFPISWKSVTGNYPSILDCAQAAHDGGEFALSGIPKYCTSIVSSFRLAGRNSPIAVAKCMSIVSPSYSQ